MTKKPLTRTLILGLALSAFAAGARAEDVEKHPGVLRVHDANVEAPSPADRQAGLAVVDKIVAALKKSLAVTKPVGYNASIGRVLNFPEGKGPATGGVAGVLFLYYLDESEGKVRVGEEGPGFGIGFNDPLGCVFADLNQPYMEDEQGPVYMEPRSDGEDHGFKHYPLSPAGGCTLVTDIKRPLWLPVSRERVLKAQIAKQEGGLKETRELAARLKSSLPGGLPEGFSEQLKNREDELAALKKQLADLSPAERAGQAFFATDGSGGPLTPIVGAGHEGATGLVTPNRAYLDKTLPRAKPQVLTVRLDMPESDQWYTPFKGEAFRKIREGMDWAALAALVKP